MYEVEECWLSERSTYKKPEGFDPDISQKKVIEKLGDSYGMDLKISQIKQLMKQGVNNFKITGREMTFEDFSSELNIYLKDVYK